MFIEVTTLEGRLAIVNCAFIQTVQGVPHEDHTYVNLSDRTYILAQEPYEVVRELLNFKKGRPWSQ